MAHNLMNRDSFIEMQGNGRKRAWHKLGLTCKPEEQLTCAEMVEKAGLNYRISKFGLLSAIPAKDGFTPFSIPGLKALIREETKYDPEKRFFGTVSEGYTIIQNTQIAELLDGMKGYHPETVGALGNGEEVFFALAAGDFEIAGDKIEEYFLVTDRKDGKGGFIFCNTKIRVVCNNTLIMGLDSATNKVSLSHSKDLHAEAKELVKVFQHLQVIKQEGQENLKKLLEVKYTDETAKEMIENIYPLPKKPQKLQLADSVDGALDTKHLSAGRQQYENQMDNVKVYRAKVEDLYDMFNDSFPKSASTGYALFNVVVEHTDFYRNSKNEIISAQSAVFGEGAKLKSKAFDLISRG